MYDYACLIGHYNAVRLGKKTDPRLLERGYSEEALEMMRSKMKRKIEECTSLNVKFTRALSEFQYPYLGYVLTLHRSYTDNGCTPFSGPPSDQPAQIMDIFNTLDALEDEFRQQEIDKQKREQKRNGRR